MVAIWVFVLFYFINSVHVYDMICFAIIYRFYSIYFKADFLLWKSRGCRDTEVCECIYTT